MDPKIMKMNLQITLKMNLKINKLKQMKKVVIFLFLTCLVSVSFAQDLKKAKSDLKDGDLDKAKTEIDGYLAKNPDDKEGLYYKAKIYEQIVSSDKYKNLVQSDTRQQVFDAFAKAMSDTSDAKMTLLAIQDRYSPIFDLYSNYFTIGADAFNAAAPTGDKAGFKEAMEDFIKANEVGQYIRERKWSTIAKVDTVLVLNIGKAAINAGENDTALKYFTMIADAHINGTKNGGAGNATYVLPYEWLALHYRNHDDEANMLKYANLGKEMFPDENYFDLLVIGYYREHKDYNKLFDRYNQLVTTRPDSLDYHFQFANQIFGYLYNSDEGVTVQSKDSLSKVIVDQLSDAYKLDSNDIHTNWLFSEYYYNKGVDLRDSASKLKGAAADVAKEKADLNSQAVAFFNQAIPYSDRAISIMEKAGYLKSDKSEYKSIVNLMQMIYTSLGQNDKVKIYQDKYDKADDKFVN
jgi:hypothetical protein